MRKNGLPVVIAIILALILTIPSQAADARRSRQRTPYLSIIGTTAYCSASYLGARQDDDIAVELVLKQGNTTVATWSASGKGSASADGQCDVKPGKTYTLVMTATVNGVCQPSTSATARS